MDQTQIIAHGQTDDPIVTVDMSRPEDRISGALGVSRRYPGSRYPEGVWRYPTVRNKTVDGGNVITEEPVRRPAWAKNVPGYTSGTPGESPDAEIFARHGAIFERDWSPEELEKRQYMPKYDQKVALQEMSLFREATANIKLDAETVKNLAGVNPALISKVLTEVIEKHRVELDTNIKGHDKIYKPATDDTSTAPKTPLPPTKAQMIADLVALGVEIDTDPKKHKAADLTAKLAEAKTAAEAAKANPTA